MAPTERPLAISKELSANDTGETGGHQAGMHIPKATRILAFFPPLGRDTKNPRWPLVFYDDEATRWEFAFIYYNGIFFGGTRNEYRLTRMMPFIRGNGLRPGDRVILRRDPESGRYFVGYERHRESVNSDSGRLRLGSGWKEIRIKERSHAN